MKHTVKLSVKTDGCMLVYTRGDAYARGDAYLVRAQLNRILFLVRGPLLEDEYALENGDALPAEDYGFVVGNAHAVLLSAKQIVSEIGLPAAISHSSKDAKLRGLILEGADPEALSQLAVSDHALARMLSGRARELFVASNPELAEVCDAL